MTRISLKRKARFVWPLLLAAGLFLLTPNLASASFADNIGNFLGSIIGLLIGAVGIILSLVVKVLVMVAQWDNFIKAAPVVYGWVVVRDICNMFFVVILLVIAIATILRLENYSYKKWLPKLILMAILINFSKTICGLLIDIAQVAMLTFVNAFKNVAAGNIVEMMGLKEIVTLAKQSDKIGFWAIVGSYILGLIYIVIALIIITAMLAMLVMRIVMIWIYVVLSPLAYLLSAFPGGSKYASQWWSEFTKNLIVGPVLAFFIWLSFVSVQGVTTNLPASDTSLQQDMASSGSFSTEVSSAAATEAATPDVFIKFIISIGMLLGGMQVTQSIGGAAAGVAGNVASKGKKLAIGAAAGAALFAARGTGRTLKNWGGDIVDKLSLKTGVDLNLASGYKRYREAVKQRRDDRKLEIRGRVLEQAEQGKTWVGRKAALFSTGDVAYDNWKEHNFFRGGSKVPAQRISQSEARIGELQEERSQVLGNLGEHIDNTEKLRQARGDRADMMRRRIATQDTLRDLTAKERAGTITEDEKKTLAAKKKEMPELERGIAAKEAEISRLSSKRYDEDKARSLDEGIKKEQDNIDKNKKRIDERSLVSMTGARIASQASVESEQGKIIAHINNADELVRIMREGIRTGQQGLVSAAWKKLARTGNYNEFNKDIGVGTGWKGMLDASDFLIKEGGFDTQTARGLVAEVGELAKSSSLHMEAFGTMKMDKAGNWEPTTELEHDSAVLAEKTKVQSQKFCRDANRLATGYYDGPIHDEAHWRPSNSTVALYASKDAQYADDLKKTGNPSQIYFMGSNPIYLEMLENNGASNVAGVIREFMEKAHGQTVTNYEEAIKRAMAARESYGVR